MKISRSVEEWIETADGCLRAYVEYDDNGVPSMVNSVRFVEDDEQHGRYKVTREMRIPAAVLERLGRILTQRRHAAGDRRLLICADHDVYDDPEGPPVCGLCQPEELKVVS